MINKGTPQYTAAQEMANKITRIAGYERRNNSTIYNVWYDPFGAFLDKVKKVDGFAAQVAGTVEAKMDPYGFKMANCSSKQAWIIACAAIENGIELA